jgi:CRISPR/Cas system-associated exonuclease Cas4 (RecB family)
LTPDSPLELEALYRLELILNRLQTLIDSGDLQVSDATLHRLLTQIIATTTIPFHGEPLEGIQIMGVLETRNLDFDHVLLLSCNEGNLPKGITDTSFIPYSIRKAYDLTTADHKVDIYRHYFRRLLQRASDVTILYNNSTSDGKTSEMSQFMHQLLVESPHPITLKTLLAGLQPTWSQQQPVIKSPEVIETLRHRFSEKPLSPSALSLYLRCPLQFFYRYVAGLDEYKEEDPMDSRLFGNIFHKAAQLLYSTDFSGNNLPFENVLARRSSSCGMFSERKVIPSVCRAVDEAIKLELFHIEDPMAKMPPLNGLQLINREVIIKYLRQLLEIDRRLAPFTILALETPLYADSATTIKIGGIVDRIDKISLPDGSERIRVVDYKTSSTRLKPLPDVAAIFDPANIKYHSDYYLQAILYACLLESKTTVSPCLLFIQHAGTDNYDPTLILGNTPITDITEIKDEFMHHLNDLLTEIFDIDTPFHPTKERTRCKSCPFHTLCQS